MRLAIILSLLLTTFGIVMYYSHSKAIDYEKLADAITKRTADKLEKEKGFILIGTGGRMLENISMMMMGFEYSQESTLENARELLLFAIQEYLVEINANEEIRPYLHDYPFTSKNIEIEIYFPHSNCSKLSLDKIDIAAASEGTLFYYAKHPNNYTLTNLHEETYVEALKIFRRQ